MGELLKRVEFVGVPSGDGECFCWDVTPDVFRAVTGREPDRYDTGIYPNQIIHAGGRGEAFRFVVETHPVGGEDLADSAKSPACGTCRFWSPDRGGECRRRAPAFGGLYRHGQTGEQTAKWYALTPAVEPVMFPPVPADGWCGEYEAK